MEYFIKNIWPVLKKDVISILAYIGAIVTINDIFELFGVTISQILYVISLIVGIIAVIVANWPKRKYLFNIKNRDIKIKLKIGDLLKEKAAIVVPTNSTFDTNTENDFISINSVQGQVQNKYFKNNITTLDYLIEKELEDKQYIEL